jgi:hypothetical protein
MGTPHFSIPDLLSHIQQLHSQCSLRHTLQQSSCWGRQPFP